MCRLPAGLAPLLLLLAAPPALAQKEFGFDNRKPSGQDYLSPEETVKRMRVAPEFEVKLFAGEPNVVNPIAFTIDERGRVWVIECFEYPSRTPPGKAPRDRIVILEDTDGDGACDKRTVFAEGKDFPVTPERKNAGLGAFDMASGIEVGHGGVYVGAPPYLWFIEDKNDKPGKFETLLSGFGSQDTHETLNTFQWGPDGWLYGLHGVFTQSNVKSLDGPETRMNAAVWRFHPKTRKFEIFAEGTSNPWGMDWRNTDGQFILACCVIPHLYHIVPGGIYRRQGGVSYNPYAYGAIQEVSDHTFHRESGWAHAGLISLDVPHVPEKYRNSVVFGSIHGCSVKQNVLKPNGSSFIASRGDDFLVSGDKNFRPINMKWGPNGDIYLIDWHDQNPCHQAKPDSWDYERGRVYRIQLKGTQPKKAEDLGGKTPDELIALVSDPNPHRRRTALRLLHALPDDRKPAAQRDPDNALFRLPPVWQAATLSAVSAMDRNAVNSFRADNGRLQALGARVEPFIRLITDSGLPTPVTIEAFAALAGTDSPTLRRELASAAVRLADTHDVTPLLRALMAHKEDATDPQIPHLVWFAYEKIIGRKQGAANPAEKELAWLGEQAPGNVFVRDQIVPRVMRRLVATGQPEDLALCLKFVADAADTNTRAKALDGLAVALAGQTVNAPEAWAALRPELAKDAGLAPLANKLAVSFRDPEAVRRAVAVLTDATNATDARAEAARQLATLKAAEARALFPKVLASDADLRVRAEAARGLAAFDDPKLPAELLKGWTGYPPAVRAELVNVLAGRKDWARELLRALDAKVVDRRDVTDNAVTRIQAFNDKELAGLIEKAWGRTRPTSDELNTLIDKVRGELAAGPGSFARGRVVFENQCAKCHTFDGRGADVGPALDGAARDIEYILANVIDPNRVIGAPYFQRIAKTLDGRVEQGLLAAEDDQSITLKVEQGQLRRIAKADLDGPVTVLEKSMMPEGLTGGMSAQDFRDLVRYLMAHPFLTAVTVNGRPAVAGVTGLIPLPDRKDAGTATVEAKVTTAADVRTQLLVSARDPFEVLVDGKPVGGGPGASGRLSPDAAAVSVTLTTGPHTVTVRTTYAGTGRGLYARLLDPDRKLTYPEFGAKN